MAAILAVCSCAACRAPASAPDEAQASEPGHELAHEPAHELELHGSFATRYRARFTSGEQDHDLYELAEVDVGDEQQDPWTGSIVADAALDLDGQADPSSPFQSLEDTYDSPLTGHVYEAYVENHSWKDLSMLRIGRQIEYRTPETISFDGAQVESRELGPRHVTLGAYGGIPARVYASSEVGDLVCGAFVEARPWVGGQARIDWLHIDDDILLGEHQNDLYALKLGQSFGGSWRLDGSYSRLEGQDRDVSARATYKDAEEDFDVQLAWFQLLETQYDLALELDPFTSVLLEQFPFSQARVMASKGLGEHVRLRGGLDVREVSDAGDVGTFNRDFTRWFATTTFEGVLPARIVLSLTGELWDSDPDDIQTWGADLSREIGANARLSLGSYYSLYKTDLFQSEERDDVRTYFLRLHTRADAGWSWDVRYEYEDSTGDYSMLALGATWRF